MLRIVSTLFITILIVSSVKAQKAYPFGNLPATSNHTLASQAYNSWKQKYVTACDNDLRVIFDNPDHTVSEGIAYGMLLAAYAQDKLTFDGLTRYYNRFKNSDGVMDWKVDGCHKVIGKGGAADAEFDYATALIVADKTWGSEGELNYKVLAMEMIATIKEKEISQGYVPMAGPGYGGDDLANPSYFSPGYFKLWGEFTNDQSYWDAVASKCYEILSSAKKIHNASYGLVPDWCASNGEYSQTAAKVGYYESGQRYHYDAARVPWRIAMDYLWYGDEKAGEYLNDCYMFTESKGGLDKIVDGYLLDGTGYGKYNSIAFSGAFATAYMYGPAGQTAVDQAYTYMSNKEPYGYFSTTLYALYMYMITGNFENPMH